MNKQNQSVCKNERLGGNYSKIPEGILKTAAKVTENLFMQKPEEQRKKNIASWRSSTVTEGCLEDSSSSKNKVVKFLSGFRRAFRIYYQIVKFNWRKS
jgi:hypothetical protein